MSIKNLLKKTKGQKLLYLSDKIELFKIPKTICLKCNDLYSSKEHLLNSELLVVRSSASDEDGQSLSSAGEYESVLNIPSNDPEKITKAINKVITSYEKKAYKIYQPIISYPQTRHVSQTCLEQV